jgi:methylated-DNA-[protein]-cysteine S-methyltransferase
MAIDTGTPVAVLGPPRPAAAARPAQHVLALTRPSPAGDLAVLLTEDGVVRAAGFADVAAMAARLPGPLTGADVREVPATADEAGVAAVVSALARYADGDLAALAEVELVQPGGPFQQRAWAAMRAVAPGRTATYAELAVAAGSPTAVRAAGSACARNLVAPFVPCHRVLRSGGTLGGYYYGLDAKRALLAHEARWAG